MSLTNIRREDRPFKYGKLVVIDLETLGLTTHAIVLSIGIIVLDEVGKLVYAKEIVLSTDVQIEFHQRDSDSKTLAWWHRTDRVDEYSRLRAIGDKQDEVAYQVNLIVAANIIASVMKEPTATIWGNSPAFDLGNLQSLFAGEGLQTPWEYWQEQDYRTLHRLAKNRGFVNKNVNAHWHNAKADAVYEANSIYDMLAHSRPDFLHGMN